ncbi:hypothetical protein SKAU_G00086520 [Synaphobranchus kaupii]|uniref:Uncharacterized protein n=1 Tax=Synaphobranchus kaupii TaxID=118154 RepID=A0A9Q1FWE1_SYNKA|nr:hypothetical protein SKAU_G00086520 [Synaphobranchus kaupii]
MPKVTQQRDDDTFLYRCSFSTYRSDRYECASYHCPNYYYHNSRYTTGNKKMTMMKIKELRKGCRRTAASPIARHLRRRKRGQTDAGHQLRLSDTLACHAGSQGEGTMWSGHFPNFSSPDSRV